MTGKPTCQDLEKKINKLENELKLIKKSEEISSVLLSITRAVSTSTNLDDFFLTTHRALIKIVDAKNFAISLVDEIQDKIYFPYFEDENEENNESLKIHDASKMKNQSLNMNVIMSGNPLFVNRSEIEERNIGYTGPIPMVWLGVPLIVKGKVIGAMSIQDYSDSNHYSEEDVCIMVSVSKQVVIAIEKKMDEEALLENEAKYRAVLDNIIEGYYEVDIKGNLTFFNNALCRILGYSEDELYGMNNRIYIGKESYEKVYQTFNNIFRTGEKTKAFECPFIRKNGEVFYAEISVSLIQNSKLGRIGFRGLVRDISERKKAEEEKKRMEAQLQYAMKMESIGTLAGGIAHNFNNLLMAIRGYAELMLLDTPMEHPFHKMLSNIEKQVDSGSRLTSQLIGYAREGKYEVRPVDLNSLVLETVDTFAMTRKEIRTRMELSDVLSGVIADQGQIEQVLMNLCVNAADAMPDGGDLIFKTKEVSHREIGGDRYEPRPGLYTCLSVSDTGLGMDDTILPHIFEPFFTTKDISRGTGLGLASTYGIVKAHGGYINVESEIGRGSSFFIYLPVAKEKTLIKEKKSPELLRGTETILFVDDDYVLKGLGFDLLSSLGYKPLLAGGGIEAVDIYLKKGNEIDLVILDMIMPDMGGGEVFDKLKDMDSQVKVLLSSGYSIDGQAKKILERGCNGFIQKPFNIRAMSHKIREILDD